MPRNGDTEKDNLKMSLVGGLVLRPLPRISKTLDVTMQEPILIFTIAIRCMSKTCCRVQGASDRASVPTLF